MYHPILRPRAQRELKKIGEADLVIGLPTFKNPHMAAHVANITLAGARQYYSHLRTVLINADAGQEAATRRAVAAQVSNNGYNPVVVTGRYDGLLGQGSAIAALLDAALALDAKAILILDSQTHTIRPSWVGGLAHLILENKADLVIARYRWPWPDGTLNDLLFYPLFRALWGQGLRHPTAPDFALSPTLATALLDKDIWETEVAAYGLPPWLTTFAVLEDWRVAQSALGEKRTWLNSVQPDSNQVTPKDIKRKEGQFKAQFQNLVSVMLRLIYDYRPRWDSIERFDSLSTLTQFFPDDTSPNPTPDIDPTPLLDNLALGWIEYRSLWQQILTPENLAQLETLAALPPDRFYFPGDLWARIIYDFAVVFNKGASDPYQVVASLYPLYLGRLAAFGQEVAGLSFVGYEGTVAAQAVEFEEGRPYLKARWQAYQSV